MILSSPVPQFGQRCKSITNTRLSSRAHLRDDVIHQLRRRLCHAPSAA
jgi:hypothetical protein